MKDGYGMSLVGVRCGLGEYVLYCVSRQTLLPECCPAASRRRHFRRRVQEMTVSVQEMTVRRREDESWRRAGAPLRNEEECITTPARKTLALSWCFAMLAS